MPRVTVVMATYNWAPVLPYSIASVLDQTFADFELRVIGDDCTDESAEVVAAIDDARVHWHNLERHHGHQSGPNNEGLARARGDHHRLPGTRRPVAAPPPGHPGAGARRVEADGGATGARRHAVREPEGSAPAVARPGWRYQSGATIPPTTVVHDRDRARAVGGWRPPSTTSAPDPDADLWAG